MTRPFELWSDRIAAATDDDARRALLAEAGQWRAQHLTDVAAMRRATFAMSRLYGLIGDRDRAVGEARQLLSLCRTAPEAQEEELQAAVGWLRALGETPPPIPQRPRAPRDRFQRERPVSPRPDGERARTAPQLRDRPDRDRPGRDRLERDRSAPRPAEGPARREAAAAPAAGGQGLGEARDAARAGRHTDILRILDGARGAGAALLRAHAALALALEGPEATRTGQLETLRDDLARAAGITAPRGAGMAGADPLSAVVGVAVPHARGPRIRLIETFAHEHPERIDELAGAALRQHVGAFGVRSAAPWLVGVAAQALASGPAPATKSAIAELRTQGALAVEAYDEWSFERLVRLLVRAREAGYAFVSLRRGVVARGEPDDRKVWTLRVIQGGVERMLAVSPHATAQLPDDRAIEIAQRLLSLCGRTALLATGSGNENLRREAAARGVVVLEHDADNDALLAAVASASDSVPRADSAASAEAEPPSSRLLEVLTATPIDPEALEVVVRGFRRPDRLLRTAQRLPLDDRQSVVLLEAMDRVLEPGRTVPEATTLAVRAAIDGEETRMLLTGGGPAAARFGGPGITEVVALARALAEGGWDVHRVLRGATRRETTAHAALDTLAPHLGGLWRLLVRRGDVRGEVWVLGDLPAEGRAGIPLLMLEKWQRVVVVPVDNPDLLAWYRATGGPEPIGWTGHEGAALRDAVGAFVPLPEPTGTAGDGSPQGRDRS